MKIHKILAVALAIILGSLTLSACQLSKILKKDAETTDESTSETSEVEEMDLMSADLTQYITLGQYKGIKVTVETPLLTEEKFDESITELLTNNGYNEEVKDRAPVPGDTVNIDFEGYMDGVKFENGSASNQTIELSDNSGYIDGFADGIIGVMPGTNVTLDLTFPTDYYEDLAGKAVSFIITVNYIVGDFIVPQLDDAFVTKYSEGEYTTVDAFKENYRSKLEADLAAEAESAAYSELWKTIVTNAEVKAYPDQQVKYYFNAQKSQYEDYAASNSVDYNTILTYIGVTEESMMESARNYTKEDLVFFAIIKAENFIISDSEYAIGAAGYAEQAKATITQLEEYYGKDYIVESLLWDKVLKQLFMWAEITK